MNIYLASSIDNKIMMQGIASDLKSKGYSITSEWIYSKNLNQDYTKGFPFLCCDSESRFVIDIKNGVLKSDIVIAFYPYGESGTLQEMAYAAASDILVVYVLPKGFESYPLICDSFLCFDQFDESKFLEYYTNAKGVILYSYNDVLNLLKIYNDVAFKQSKES